MTKLIEWNSLSRIISSDNIQSYRSIIPPTVKMLSATDMKNDQE